MVLKWAILLSIAVAVKLDQASEESSEDVQKLLSKLMQGDRDGVRTGLMDIAMLGNDARIERAFASLAAAGFEPEDIDKWILHETSTQPKASLDAKVLPEVTGNFQRLVYGLQHAELNTTKMELSLMAQHGGQSRIKNTLRGLELLGFDVRAVQNWLSAKGKSPFPKVQTEKMVLQPMADAYRVLSGLHQSDREAVKSVLNDLVQAGGQTRIQQALVKLTKFGVDAKKFEAWMSGSLVKAPELKFGAPVVQAEASKEDAKLVQSDGTKSKEKSKDLDKQTHEDVLSMVQGLQSSNKLIVKGVLSEMYRKGGVQRLKRSLQALQDYGYDVEEVKKWYSTEGQSMAPKKAPPTAAQAKTNTSPLQPNSELKRAGKQTVKLQQIGDANDAKRSAHATAESEEKSLHAKAAKQNNGDAERLEKALLLADKSGIKQTLKYMLKNGGQHRIQNALAALQGLGYDADEVQKWLSESVGSEGPPKASSKLALTESDAEQIATGLKNADKAGVKESLKVMMDKGGQIRLQEAFKQLSDFGYDPDSVQQWLLKQGDGTAPKPRSPVKPEEAALEMSRSSGSGQDNHTDAKTDPDAVTVVDEHLVLDSLQHGNKAAMKHLLQMMIGKGGEDRVDKAFDFLPRMGFDLESVKDWLQRPGDDEPPTPQHPVMEAKAGSKHELQNQTKPIAAPQETVQTASGQTQDPQEALKKSVEKSDKAAAKDILKSLLGKGGENQIVSALATLQKFGYDPTSIQHWLTSEGESPAPKTNLEHQPSVTPPQANQNSVPASPATETATSISQETADAQLLADSLDKADKSGMRTAIGLMAKAGGKDRIKNALSGLHKFGYDPDSVAYWMSTYKNDAAPKLAEKAAAQKASLSEVETIPDAEGDLADGVHVMEVKHFQLSVKTAADESSGVQERPLPIVRRETVRHLADVQPSFLEINPVFLRGGRTLEEEKDREVSQKDQEIASLKAQLYEADRHADSLKTLARVHGF